ncbi:IclR family transcriptional regulator [Peribacillus sp. Hz7]|uniref:IclR family transcriptional regulator n=1 Tax=Peribacillus sp. Hz7 TaxID=3344873 RepID=UPI0035CA1CD9
MDQETFNKNYTMQSLHKAIKVLKAFTREEPRLSLTELNKKTGISISSLQRFVSTLVYEGFLHKDERTKQYQLGLSLMYLGRLVEEESSIVTAAESILKTLNEEIGESVSLSVVDGDERRCIYNLASKYPLAAKAYVGDTAPLYAGASAKVLLAFLPKEQFERYMASVVFNPITENTLLSKEALEDSLEVIKQQGFAISYSERVKGAHSVAAPILTPAGHAIASVTIVIPDVRYKDFEEQHLISLVTNAARTIEEQLY